MTPAVEAKGLSRRYRVGWWGSKTGLADTDLSVPPGEGLALIGPNGAGKSTLLLLLAGLRQPSAGTIRICGLDSRQPGARAKLGIASESVRLPGRWRTVDLLQHCGRLCGMDRGEAWERAADLLDRLLLSAVALNRVDQLSAGQRSRVGLAAAMLHRPSVLLLDEPLAGLDPATTTAVLEVLVEERQRGAAMIVATHRLSDLSTACDRVARVDDGELQRLGPTAQVLTHIRTRIVYTLPIGSSEPEHGTLVANAHGIRARVASTGRRDLVIAEIQDAGGTILQVQPLLDRLGASNVDAEETLA